MTDTQARRGGLDSPRMRGALLRGSIDAVVEWIQANVLQEEIILATLKEVRRRLGERAKTSNTERPELEAQIRAARIEIDRLSAALLSTDDKPRAIVKMIAEREKRIGALEARLNTIRAAPSVLDLEARRMEKEARKRLEDLKGTMQRKPEEARKAMEALLNGPLKFTSEGKRYRIEGDTAVKGLFLSLNVA
jgi:chromosome segregation ATPase